MYRPQAGCATTLDGMTEAKWRQIWDDLRVQIVTGQLAPGDKMPTEADLMDRYGVARGTVRPARQLLINEGLVVPDTAAAFPRSTGLRVASPHLWELHVSRPPGFTHPGEAPTGGADAFMADMLAAGRQPHQQIAVVNETASAEVAARLSIEPGDRVVSRRLVRYVDGREHNWVTYWFPAAVVAGTILAEQDSVTEGTVPWLERNRGPVEHEWRLTWRSPDPDERAHLKIPPGWNVGILWRVARGPHGPVMVSKTVLPGDRVELVGP